MRTPTTEQAIRPLFPVGRLLITPGALAALVAHDRNGGEFVQRHQSGDFGDLDEEDREANQAALRYGTRLLSSYVIDDDVTLWIITEADRSVTTLLLPEEY